MSELERKEQMADNPIATMWQNAEEVKILAVECKFKIENGVKGALGGLAEGNLRSIEFEGDATMDVMHELAEAIRRVSKS